MPDTVMSQIDAPPLPARSSSVGALAGALAAAQKNFAPIPKNREVTVVTRNKGTYKFKYATLDGILSATMPALSEQGLAVVQTIIHDTEGNPGLETTLYHSSGEWLRSVTPMFLAGRQTDDGRTLPPSNQELGSAQSYARRYGLSALLCVAADEDDDGNIADGNHMENSRDIPYRSRGAGTAGGGKDFRPARRSPGMAQTESLKVDPQDRDMIQGDGRSQYEADKAKKAAPINTAAAAGNAIKRLEWVKASIGYLADKDEHVARDWWVENRPRIDVVETALPKAFEELLDAYDRALERKVTV